MASDCISGATSLAQILHRRAERHPERRALTFIARGTEERKAHSFAGLDQRARTIAALLKSHGVEGDRALLLYPQSAEYVEAFLGCLYAGTVAVPAYPPDPTRLERTLGRLLGIIADCRPKVVLSTAEICAMAAAFAEQVPGLGELTWLATDQADLGVAPLESPASARSEQLAFLQYTSGSTSSPKGVMVSHGNLLANLAHIRGSVALGEDSCSVTWLPSFHDMGLVDGLLEGFYSGYPVYLMSPADFLKHPLRWLQAVSAFKVTHSGGPNFGYELCVRKATPEALAALDLSSWRSAYCGAEPVRAGTMRRFIETFSPRGFSPSALFPVFGLAEVTLKAPGPQGRGVVTLSVDKEALKEDRVLPLPAGDANAAEIVSCGESEEGYGLAIVDPSLAMRCRTGAWGRSGYTARAWHRATGASRSCPRRRSVRASVGMTRASGCARETWASSGTGCCTSPAGRRTSSSSVGRTTIRRTSSGRWRRRCRRCGRGVARPSRWRWRARSGWWWWQRWTRGSSRGGRFWTSRRRRPRCARPSTRPTSCGCMTWCSSSRAACPRRPAARFSGRRRSVRTWSAAFSR
uniref:AMP-binding protein n=1 Tax=Archangium lansingense TaxID=2995310 RepID=UPI00358DB813